MGTGRLRCASRRSRGILSDECVREQRGRITFEAWRVESYIHDARATGHRHDGTSTIRVDASGYNKVWMETRWTQSGLAEMAECGDEWWIARATSMGALHLPGGPKI